MSTIAEHLFKEAQVLDSEERVALAGRLLESVTSENEVFAAHLAIAHERLGEVLSGKVTPVSRESTLKRVRELLRKGSAA